MNNTKLFIGDTWRNASEEETFASYNPATGEIIAQIAKGTRNDAGEAIKEAKNSFQKFREWSIWERANLLKKIANTVDNKKEDLAYFLTLDQGKPMYTEAVKEVESVIRNFHETAEQIKWLETSVIPVKDRNKRVFSSLNPKGVYAVITPWNYPYMVPTEFIAPGIAAGNTLVWAPAPTTSLAAVKLMECFIEAGLPKGVINLVTGMGDTVGDEIVIHEDTNAIAFCGSTRTGNVIAKRGAGKPLLLEMGGNGPTIVCEDTDIDFAAESIAKATFTNAGQICSSTEKIIAHKDIYDKLSEKIATHANNIILGDPFNKNTTMGPMNNKEVLKKNIEHAKDSKEKGSLFITSNNQHTENQTGFFFSPKVVTDIKRDSLYFSDETFGPVAPIICYSSIQELKSMVHDNSWGLTAAIFTDNINKAFKLAEEIPTGLVNINDNSDYWEPHIPFGGVTGKSSGMGRVGGKHAILGVFARPLEKVYFRIIQKYNP